MNDLAMKKEPPVKCIHLVLAAGVLELVMLGGLLLGGIQAQRSMTTLSDKVAALEEASTAEDHNLEMQAQFTMMASRLSAVQADLTQIKARLLQP
ncbi:hypothetical protein AUK40_03925 [Candidatus Wirthbacteria bacterium CG2_30_54_11]|uniref:Uncharacterized protein n=1 Tax=Candidatus Wirthbacteria bacterium CG2_30_54_11 TaxID=1817892 RepID=A0A1J5IVC8_9BACT|nr:MAG: hypothetical protein AUK40_03925 [Candidatus Wirthbacteria bacterium CG2_30_54_11]